MDIHSSSSESDDSTPTISLDMAHEALEIVFEWLEADDMHLLLVENWMAIAAKKRWLCNKQPD